MTALSKLAIVTTHPIQYYSPWFKTVAADPEINLRVFYLCKPHDQGQLDPDFQQQIKWDIPLLEGYSYEWINNTSSAPGSHHFNGIQNPDAIDRLEKWNPDYILCLGYNYRTFIDLCFSRRLKSVPFLIRGDSHRLAESTEFSQKIKDVMIRLLFKRFSAALSCGTANHQYFQYLGFSSDQIHFCPHGIDTSRFTPERSDQVDKLRNEWGIPEDHRILLFAGKFIHKKRPLDLLEAFRQLNPPHSSLIFVGDGPLRPQLENAASKHVQILRFINQSDMPDVYRAADLIVLPSYGKSETWGLAVQEALACGTPAIVSDHCGCHLDLVTNDQNGLIFRAGDITSLKECLQKALVSDSLERWRAHTSQASKRYNYQTSLQGLKEAIGL